jgi:hypothetical protein
MSAAKRSVAAAVVVVAVGVVVVVGAVVVAAGAVVVAASVVVVEEGVVAALPQAATTRSGARDHRGKRVTPPCSRIVGADARRQPIRRLSTLLCQVM